MTRVAVVILNFNGRELLRQFLPGVVQHSGDATVVVADNGSTDGSVAWLQTNHPSVRLIALPTNLGFCGGYNAALRQVEATYYVLLNSDVEVTPGWVEPVVALMDNNPAVAAAQPKIRSYHQRQQFEYAGAAGGFIDALGYPFCRGRIFETVEEDEGQYNNTQPVFWATGACLFVRAQVYHQLGGLDEDFFAHMEEIDLCWRIKRSGGQVFYVGRSTVYHVGGGTLAAHHPRKTYLNFRNGLALLVHHVPLAALWWKLPLRLFLDWVAALRIIGQSPRSAMAIWSAHAHLFGAIGRTWAKRRKLASKLPGWHVTEVYPRLLVFDYFVLGLRRFGRLKRF